MVCMETSRVDERLAGEMRAAMARHRISQATLADALSVSQAAVSRRLSGRVPFTVHDVEIFARVLQMPLSDLLGPVLVASLDREAQ